MMRKVNMETQETIDRVFPEGRPLPAPEPHPAPEAFLISSTSSGFLTSFNKDALLRVAKDTGAVVRIDQHPGSSLVEGIPFAPAWPVAPGAIFTAELRQMLITEVNEAVTTGFERTDVQDVGFGFRQLVDVAARALSPGINDPTTAVHVIGHLSVLVCRLAERTPGGEYVTDDGGRVRVVVSLPQLPDLLDMAMNQARQYGAADSAVAARLIGLLYELTWCDQGGRYRTEILDHLDRMRNAIGAAGYSPAERKNLSEQLDSLNLLEARNPHPRNNETTKVPVQNNASCTTWVPARPRQLTTGTPSSPLSQNPEGRRLGVSACHRAFLAPFLAQRAP